MMPDKNRARRRVTVGSNVNAINDKLNIRISCMESIMKALKAVDNETKALDASRKMLQQRRAAIKAEMAFENARRVVAILHEDLLIIDKKEFDDRMEKIKVEAHRDFLRVSPDAAVSMESAFAVYVDGGEGSMKCPRCSGRCNVELAHFEDNLAKAKCLLCDHIWELKR